MKKIAVSSLLSLLLVLFSSLPSQAAVEVTLFEDTFVRGTGKPIPVVSDPFTAIAGAATVRLWNGAGKGQRVSSSEVYINGQLVFGPKNFKQNVSYMEATVDLNDGINNVVKVTLKSKPGGFIHLAIDQLVEADSAGVCSPTGCEVAVGNSSSTIQGASIKISQWSITNDIMIQIEAVVKPIDLSGQFISCGEYINFGPDGTIFDIPAVLTIPYLDKDNDDYIDGTDIHETEVGVSYYNEVSGVWEDIEVINRDTYLNIVQVETNHLSTYVTSVKDLRLFSTYDQSKKFFLKGKIKNYGENNVVVDLTFYNSSGAWILLTPNFEEPGYADFTDVILVPSVNHQGTPASIGSINFSPGQHLKFDIEKVSTVTLTVTAIDIIMRGIFGTRFDPHSLNTLMKSSMVLLSTLGEYGHLSAMVGYLADGDWINGTKEALAYITSADWVKVEKIFTDIGLIKAFKFIDTSLLSNLFSLIGIADKGVLLAEIAIGFHTAPENGFVRLEVRSDIDGDRIPDEIDNCPNTYNPDQADSGVSAQ